MSVGMGSMFNWLHYAWQMILTFGIGGTVAIAAVVVCIMVPRFLFVAAIVAVCAVAGMAVYSKGIYDEHVVRVQRDTAAAANALKAEAAARASANATVRAERTKPSRVRDPRDRDGVQRVAPAKPTNHRALNLRPVAPHQLFGVQGHSVNSGPDQGPQQSR